MLPISTTELNLARTEYNTSILDDTAVIIRKERVDGPDGQPVDREFTYGPYPARVVDLRVNRPIEIANRQSIVAVMVFEVLLPHGTLVKTNDRITVTTRDSGDQNTYEVLDSNGIRSDNLLTMVNIEKLN